MSCSGLTRQGQPCTRKIKTGTYCFSHRPSILSPVVPTATSSPLPPGQVVLRKQPFYRDPTILDKTHPRLPGFTNIQVCSNTAKGKLVSPMCLGPVLHVEDGHTFTCPIFENFWQHLKVYTHELDAEGHPSPAYFTRRNAGWLDLKPHRRVFPKKKLQQLKSQVEYVFYQGRKYDRQTSKKEIYCPLYSQLVESVPYYHDLRRRKAQGENLLLLGFDGFSFDPTTDDWWSPFENESIIVGHEYVLLALLCDVRPWMTGR